MGELMKRNTRDFLVSFLIFGIVISGAAIGLRYYFVPRAKSTNYAWQNVLAKPPINGSQAEKIDIAAVRHFQNQETSARWRLAIHDNTADIFEIYRPILGSNFTRQNHRELNALLNYAALQLNLAGGEAKVAFGRPRPFVTNSDLNICAARAPTDYSYPSGHAALGWLSARILSQFNPNHASEILARGREFGESRVVCGVHYPSDVAGGQALANIMLAYLAKDPEYIRLHRLVLQSHQ